MEGDDAFWSSSPSREVKPKAVPAPLSDDSIFWREDLACYHSDTDVDLGLVTLTTKSVAFSGMVEIEEGDPFGPLGPETRATSTA